MDLHNKSHWIFDLDGTLTIAVHDFMAIRHTLQCPADIDILTYLNSLPAETAEALHQQLQTIEVDLAAQSQPADGVFELLEELQQRQAKLGILTRNTRQNALLSLEVLGLSDYFPINWIIGREQAEPKPSPDGIQQLANQWQVDSNAVVMTGDYLYDLQSGRAAGATTVHVDQSGEFQWDEWTDVAVTSLAELHQQLLETA